MDPLAGNTLFFVQIENQLKILAQGLDEGVKVRAEKYFILKGYKNSFLHFFLYHPCVS
jgi:hypothetical protein